jgi:hypothetical protein
VEKKTPINLTGLKVDGGRERSDDPFSGLRLYYLKQNMLRNGVSLATNTKSNSSP